MRKIQFLLMVVCLLIASCSKEESQPETGEAGIYHITVTVTGNSPKGSVHLYNLNGVKFRNERNGTSSIYIDESFTGKVEYNTEATSQPNHRTKHPLFKRKCDHYHAGNEKRKKCLSPKQTNQCQSGDRYYS